MDLDITNEIYKTFFACSDEIVQMDGDISLVLIVAYFSLLHCSDRVHDVLSTLR